MKLKLRSTWSDGTSHLVLEPHELIEKLVPLVPKPGTNGIVYHGSLAPRAKDRDKIVASGRPPAPIELDWPVEQELFDDEPPDRATCKYYSHSELMKRVFGVDALECPRCSGRLRFINNVTEPLLVLAVLASIGLSPTSPPRPQRRGPIQLPLFPLSVQRRHSRESGDNSPAASEHLAHSVNSRAPPSIDGRSSGVD